MVLKATYEQMPKSQDTQAVDLSIILAHQHARGVPRVAAQVTAEEAKKVTTGTARKQAIAVQQGGLEREPGLATTEDP